MGVRIYAYRKVGTHYRPVSIQETNKQSDRSVRDDWSSDDWLGKQWLKLGKLLINKLSYFKVSAITI